MWAGLKVDFAKIRDALSGGRPTAGPEVDDRDRLAGDRFVEAGRLILTRAREYVRDVADGADPVEALGSAFRGER